jgi:predicted phosphodiesterase
MMASPRQLIRFALTTAVIAACAVPSPMAQAPAPQARPQTTSAAKPPAAAAATAVMAPTAESSLRFAVLGDTGTGDRPQYQIGAELAKARAVFPFEFVIMVGDNLYGSERPQDFQRKFELPYKEILDSNVPFYASLGNHDDPNQRFYKAFNMNGERYHTFKAPQGNARFFAIDSNYVDQEQVAWLEKELPASTSDWKICFFHHPIYSSGERHGSDVQIREQLEPLFVKYGVDVVFTGHEHFYERIRPQQGITYFIAGSSAKLRKGNIGPSPLTAKGFDQGYTFMLIEIDKDQLHFQTISDQGRTIDSGVVQRRDAKPMTDR